MHDEAILCVNFTKDGECLVSGSQDGNIKVWQIRTGRCLRKFMNAHSEGVLSVSFSKDGFKILSSSFDHTVKIHGLKSGRTIKTFRGHNGFVYSAIWVKGGSQILSASGDGTIRLWDSKTTDCINQFKPIPSDTLIYSVQLIHKTDTFVVCNQSNTVYIMNLEGQVLKSFSTGKRNNGDFVCCRVSPRGGWIYCIGEDKVLYCFSVETGKLEHMLPSHERPVLGIDHHPSYNIITTYADDGELKLWKA